MFMRVMHIVCMCMLNGILRKCWHKLIAIAYLIFIKWGVDETRAMAVPALSARCP